MSEIKPTYIGIRMDTFCKPKKSLIQKIIFWVKDFLGLRGPVVRITAEELSSHIHRSRDLKETIKKLQHEYDTTRGLWCIDKSPQDVSIEWIRENAFQLT